MVVVGKAEDITSASSVSTPSQDHRPLPSHPESVHVNHVHQKTGRGIGKEKCGSFDSFDEAREPGL